MTDLQDTTMGSFVIKTEMRCKGIFCVLAVGNLLIWLPILSMKHRHAGLWLVRACVISKGSEIARF